jgi:hypothetical protein
MIVPYGPISATRRLLVNLHLPVVEIPLPSGSVCVFTVPSTRSICTRIDRASVKPKVFAAAYERSI